MDIQGYIIDYWHSRLNDSHPILTVYDREGIYQSLLQEAVESGLAVVDTTKQPMIAYGEMSEAWSQIKDDSSKRVLVYRKRAVPNDDEQRRDEPYQAVAQSSVIFPVGANDTFVNICHRFLPSKSRDIDALQRQGTLTFENVNNLQEGASYPVLETLTGGRSLQEIVLGLLIKDNVTSLNWLSEWRRLVNTHFPGMDTSGTPTLIEVQNRMWQYLLFSEFVLDLPCELPSSLQTVARASEAQQTSIYDINRRIRNQVDMRDYYVEAAEAIARDLDLERLFDSAEDLGNIVTFAFENRVEYDRFVHFIEVRNLAAAAELCAKNRKGIWYSADGECRAFWNIAYEAVALLEAINKGMKPAEKRDDMLEWYAAEGYKADTAMRHFMTLFKQNNYGLPQLTKLLDIVDGAYRTFSDRIVRLYQDFTKGDGFTHGDLAENLGIFDKVIYPALKKGKRVVMVMADAFRYEMGKEFVGAIAQRFPKAECTPSLAYIPTVTRFGMAALLPGAAELLELRPIEGKLEPFIKNKQVSTPEKRIEIIKAAIGDGFRVEDTRLEDFNPTHVPTDTKLLVIRSVKIDSACESCDTQGLGTMELEVRNLVKAMESVRALGFDEAYIFADHGYMLQTSFRQGDKVEKPTGNDIVLSERRCIAGNLNESEDTIQFTPSQAFINANFPKIAFAKGFGVFEAGKAYFHEGLSLQENVVPIVHITLSKEKNNEKVITYGLTYKGKKEGTVRIHRPMIEISAEGDALFGDEVRVKMQVMSAGGAVVGQPVETDYYNPTTDSLTIPTSSGIIKQPIELNEELIGEIVIRLLNPDNGKTLAELRLNTDLN